MGFLIYCDNKGCGKENEPLLDLEKDQVECSLCGGVINVPSFTKVSMRSMGQIKRVTKNKLAFSVACVKCKKSNQPILNNEKLYCPECQNLHILAAPYANAVKQYLVSKNKEVNNKMSAVIL